MAEKLSRAKNPPPPGNETKPLRSTSPYSQTGDRVFPPRDRDSTVGGYLELRQGEDRKKR
ncbi:hypothetical protein YC2023_012209 [Brassica napus]